MLLVSKMKKARRTDTKPQNSLYASAESEDLCKTTHNELHEGSWEGPLGKTIINTVPVTM